MSLVSGRPLTDKQPTEADITAAVRDAPRRRLGKQSGPGVAGQTQPPGGAGAAQHTVSRQPDTAPELGAGEARSRGRPHGGLGGGGGMGPARYNYMNVVLHQGVSSRRTHF